MTPSPLLSICIPTYNHAEYLEKMLAQLTALPSFRGGEVEIVISDNASTDATQAVGKRYAERFSQVVRYYRNEENVFDTNFERALARGTGRFLKLANDTLLFSDRGLGEILTCIRRWESLKCVLFFSNVGQNGHEGTEKICQTFDDFFDEVSFHSTWIGSFGLWREDFQSFKDFSRASKLQLSQVDVLCRLLFAKTQVVVNRVKFADSLPRRSIGGYNLAQVFGRNYFSILREYVEKDVFSRSAFRREKFRMLRYHILPFYLTFSPCCHFPKSGYLRYLVRDYWMYPFYWLVLPFVVGAWFMQWCLDGLKGRG